MGCKYSMFSKMRWLDKEIERNAQSSGRNYYSDCYYQRFLNIRNAQESGQVSDETYCDTLSYICSIHPEEGYYMANIHYDMFTSDALEAEKRTLHFLINSDPNVLRHNPTLKQFILSDILFFIHSRQNQDVPIEVDMFEYYGNDIEKEILRTYNEIYPKRPIIDRVEFDIYNLVEKKCKKYIFDVNKMFSIVEIPLSSNGSHLLKQSKIIKSKEIAPTYLDEYFTKLYALVESSVHESSYSIKGSNEYIRIKVNTENCYLNLKYSSDKIDKFINLLSIFLEENSI